jgi:polygalacturonase
MTKIIRLAALLSAAVPLANAETPAFYNVVDYGAIPDGKTNDTAAIARAVAACAAEKGGTVIFPSGRYLTGSIVLESNITLQLEAGSELLYSPDPADSPIVASRWESTNAYTHAPLIYANGKQNIGIVGPRNVHQRPGPQLVVAQRSPTTPERSAEARPTMEAWLKLYERIEAGEKPGPAEFSVAAAYLRPSLVQLYGCRNVLVEGVT